MTTTSHKKKQRNEPHSTCKRGIQTATSKRAFSLVPVFSSVTVRLQPRAGLSPVEKQQSLDAMVTYFAVRGVTASLEPADRLAPLTHESEMVLYAEIDSSASICKKVNNQAARKGCSLKKTPDHPMAFLKKTSLTDLSAWLKGDIQDRKEEKRSA